MHRKYCCIATILGGGVLVYMLIATFNYFYGFFWYSVLLIFIIRSRFMQITYYVEILHNYLQILNKQLQQIVTVKLNKSQLFAHIDCSVVESLQRLLILKEIYTDISQSIVLYNDIFGWAIANVVICSYLTITVHVYWCFLTLDGFYHFRVLCSAISVLIPITTITIVFGYNCEQLYRKNSKTMSLVKQLIGISNAEYKAVAYEFSLQLHSRPMYVTAKGFFQVDMSMFMTIGAYIASMIVILVQFSSAEFEGRNFHSRKNITT